MWEGLICSWSWFPEGVGAKGTWIAVYGTVLVLRLLQKGIA